MWYKIFKLFRNKYFLVFVAVLVWLLFFDTHSFIQQWRMRREINELERERRFYLEEIARDSTAIEELTGDPDALERYAREQYLMKREGEDVYIIVDD